MFSLKELLIKNNIDINRYDISFWELFNLFMVEKQGFFIDDIRLTKKYRGKKISGDWFTKIFLYEEKNLLEIDSYDLSHSYYVQTPKKDYVKFKTTVKHVTGKTDYTIFKSFIAIENLKFKCKLHSTTELQKEDCIKAIDFHMKNIKKLKKKL